MRPPVVRQCACGCGQYLGPRAFNGRFKRGHHMRLLGTRSYPTIQDGPRSVTLHRLRAERALGKRLPPGAEVHHADDSKDPNAPLVICQDAAYHKLLHIRARLVRAGGNPNTDRMCSRCGPRPLSAFTTTRRTCRACRRIESMEAAAAARLVSA